MNAAAGIPVIPVGTRLRGRFHLLEVIGQGGVSTIYRAVDLIGIGAHEQNPEVAIKVIKPGTTVGEELIVLLHREARLLRGLVHDHLVRVYDSDYDSGYHFLIMELLQGRSLAAIMNDREGRPLSRAVALRIVGSVGDGLEHLHRLGIVHGDLKPGNVFMTADGEVKILDFGTALAVDAPLHQPAGVTSAHLLDRVGALTPTYASLEMLSGEPRTETDDVYSLAVLAYVLLSGAHPFGQRTAEEAYQERLAPARLPGLTADQWRVLSAGLAFRRRDRIQSAAEFTRRLLRPQWYHRFLRSR